MPFIILLIFLQNAFAVHVTTGLYQSLLKVQDQKGKTVKRDFHPHVELGYNWRTGNDWGFSPQIGYIYNIQRSEDKYSEYKVHTFNILYDFVWLPIDSMKGPTTFAMRMGLGTFIKRISGKGGSVTVPNAGSGTATAYRPKGTQTSYSSTINLGADYTFKMFEEYFENLGLRFETYTFRALSKYRSTSYTFGVVGYF